jgi:RNA polymerase sigma-70 factor (ECF subfamily)
MQDSLTQIWLAFIKGDKKGFANLYEITFNRLYHYGIKFTTDEEMVKDCIQELFIKLYKHHRALPEAGNPLFYLFRALKNLLIDAMQQKEKRMDVFPQEIPFHAKFVYTPQTEEDDEDMEERVEELINHLSARQKEAIYLRYQADMSYEEIGSLLGINYQSARNLIHRSIEKIRNEIKKNNLH